MRILNICAYTWAIGGPARVIYDLTQVAAQQGHAVDILSPITPGDRVYPTPEGVRVIVCQRTTPISRVYREFSLDMYKFLKSHIQDYDIIHIHGIWHFGSLAPYLFKHKAAIVVTIHGLLDQWAINHHKWKKDIVSFLYQKRLLQQADLIHVFNNDEARDVQKYLGQAPLKQLQLPNGIRLEDYHYTAQNKNNFKKRLGIQDHQKVVLFMSRLNIKKGLDLLLPAFRNHALNHSDTVLVLAGPDDGYEASARTYVAENQLATKVVFAGMLTGEQKLEALAESDVFILPSYSEGFSIAVLEAMASQIPCIVTDKVGFAEYITQYQAACITDTTVSSVQASIEQVLQSNTLQEAYAKNAYQMVKEHFDIKLIAEKMLEAYSELR